MTLNSQCSSYLNFVNVVITGASHHSRHYIILPDLFSILLISDLTPDLLLALFRFFLALMFSCPHWSHSGYGAVECFAYRVTPPFHLACILCSLVSSFSVLWVVFHLIFLQVLSMRSFLVGGGIQDICRKEEFSPEWPYAFYF